MRFLIQFNIILYVDIATTTEIREKSVYANRLSLKAGIHPKIFGTINLLNLRTTLLNEK
jgi:hypothetical protein